MRCIRNFILIIILSAAGPPVAWASDSIRDQLEAFTKTEAEIKGLVCKPSRSPASLRSSNYLKLYFKTTAGVQALIVETTKQKITQVSHQATAPVNDGQFILNEYKSFVPKSRSFRIDAVGDSRQKSLVLNNSKPDYMQALEKLAPLIKNCCQSRSCKQSY